MVDETVIPSPSLVILVGPSGAGKSTWADTNFLPGQVLSSDHFRALVGSGPADRTAGTEAFSLVDQLLGIRLGKGLTTVIDSIGLDAERRARYREAAEAAGMACVAVGFDTEPEMCRARNRRRRHPVPKTVLDKQLRQWRKTKPALADERYDAVVIDPGPVRLVTPAMLDTAPVTTADQPNPAVTASDRARRDLNREGRESQGRQNREGGVVDRATGAAEATTPETPRATPEAPQETSSSFDLVVSSYDFDDPIEPTLVAIAGAAERAGFRSLWVMDHFRQVPQVGRPWEPMLECYTTLAYLAAKTDRLRLGTLVTGVEHRNIGLLAKIVATLDVLSAGRAECGLGAGWFSAEQAAYGYPVNPDQVRLDTLEDALQALPLLWGPGAKPFSGKVLQVPEAMGYPRPLQDPIPILVGGGGERRTLRLAARFADACNVMGDPATVAHKIGVLESHCAEVGRDRGTITVTTLNPLVHATSGRSLAELVEALRPPDRSAESFAAASSAATTEEHVERFGLLGQLGVDRFCVALTGNQGPERVEAFAEVIAAVDRA